MPTFGFDYGKTYKLIKERRDALIKKWKDKGCTDQKIWSLIQRRINSQIKYW
jgi:hypothetical protein